MTNSLLFSNDAGTVLATALTTGSTTIQVTTGTGLLFPSITAGSGNTFYMSITDAATRQNREIVLCTATPSADTFTVVRAQQGFAAQNWLVNDIVQRTVTAADMQAFVQKTQSAGRIIGAPVVISITNSAYAIPTDPTTGLLASSFYAEVLGGGGGGGTAALTGAGQASVCTGGNSGNLECCYGSLAGLTTIGVSIGGGGSPGNGGPTVLTWGSNQCDSGGGAAGATGVAATTSFPQFNKANNNGASVTPGNVTSFRGQFGGDSYILGATNVLGGNGGCIPPYGTGGSGVNTSLSEASGNGIGYGSGGGGGGNVQNSSASNGGNGAPGCVKIQFYA